MQLQGWSNCSDPLMRVARCLGAGAGSRWGRKSAGKYPSASENIGQRNDSSGPQKRLREPHF